MVRAIIEQRKKKARRPLLALTCLAAGIVIAMGAGHRLDLLQFKPPSTGRSMLKLSEPSSLITGIGGAAPVFPSRDWEPASEFSYEGLDLSYLVAQPFILRASGDKSFKLRNLSVAFTPENTKAFMRVTLLKTDLNDYAVVISGDRISLQESGKDGKIRTIQAAKFEREGTHTINVLNIGNSLKIQAEMNELFSMPIGKGVRNFVQIQTNLERHQIVRLQISGSLNGKDWEYSL